MQNKFHVIIPARYQSTRLPGKLLMDIHGQSVLERVYRQVLKANPSSITIATDHEDIVAAASNFGAKVILTARDHQSGTDRIAEVVAKIGFAPDEIIVNVQGDEPFIPPEQIQQVANILACCDVPMATLCWPIDALEVCNNSNVVKVVRDHENNAMYFSRSPIPFNRDERHSLKGMFKHIGVYAYRAEFLLQMVNWSVCDLELIELLEQLRVLWRGHKIKVEQAHVPPQQDVNTLEDLMAIRRKTII